MASASAGITLVAAFNLEFYCAVHECEECVVFAHAYVCTGVVLSTPLTDDDVAGYYLLATKFLNAQAFAVRLTTVARTADAFLMYHFLILF